MKKCKSKILNICLSILCCSLLTSAFFPVLLRPVKAENAAPYQAEFINTLAPTARQLGNQYGLFPSIMIAQAILESDWGRSGLASAPYFNLFGIKAPDDSEGIVFDTQEDDGLGNLFWIRDSFRRYNSINESMVDYAKLFRSTPFLERHYANFLNASTVQEAANALTGTYATDTNYGRSLMNIIIAYDLLRFDADIGRGPSWALIETNDYVYVTLDKVNIRRDHSTDQEPIGQANTNDRFYRYGHTTGWSKIRLDSGEDAYIATQFLSTSRIGPDGEPTGIVDEKDEQVKEEVENPQSAENIEEPKSSGFTEQEILEAKKEADEAIAHQNNSPTAAPTPGVIGVRTLVDTPKTQVNRNALEGLLGSDVNLPFVSDTVKHEYALSLQEARNLYYKADVTQEKIDAIVNKLKDLQAKASDENVIGTQVDQRSLRLLHSTDKQASLEYTKASLEVENPQLSYKATRKPSLSLDHVARIRDIGERFMEIYVAVEDPSNAEIQPSSSVRLRLKVPSDFAMDRLVLYKFEDDLKLTAQKIQVLDEQHEILLKQNLLGRYILVEKKPKNPKIVLPVLSTQVQAEEKGSSSENSTAQKQFIYPSQTFIFPYIFFVLLLVLLRWIYCIYKQRKDTAL